MRIPSSLIFFLFAALCFQLRAHAQQTIKVQTKWDLYRLDKKGSAYFLGGKKVAPTHLNTLLTLISTDATAPCPENFQSQITVTESSPGRKPNVSRINLDQGLLKSEKGCLMISGSGLDGFPMARSWLIGPFERSVQVLKNLSYASQKENFAARLEDGQWELTSENPTFNYEFLEQFLRSLKNFHVDRFILLDGAKTKEKVTLKVDGSSVVFYHLAPTTWALQEGGKPWGMISSRWSAWKDLSHGQWTDSYAKEITALLSAETPTDQKEDQLEKLGVNWSESLKRAYQHCLLNDSFEEHIRLLCLQKMRRRPTKDNTKTVMRLIENTESPRLLAEAGDYLRIQNPKGPRYSEKTDASRFRREWKSWWAKHSRP